MWAVLATVAWLSSLLLLLGPVLTEVEMNPELVANVGFKREYITGWNSPTAFTFFNVRLIVS
jgi:hypothetical protein